MNQNFNRHTIEAGVEMCLKNPNVELNISGERAKYPMMLRYDGEKFILRSDVDSIFTDKWLYNEFVVDKRFTFKEQNKAAANHFYSILKGIC